MVIRMKPGKFVTFEGGEGSGKSTQSKLLYDYLISQNIDAIWTREIGGTPAAEKIRNVIMTEELDSESELLLIIAARVDHVHKLIMPSIRAGKWVICDRFSDSTLAYQGVLMDSDKIIRLNDMFLNNFQPDVTFFIDVPPEIGLERAIARGNNNKFEAKDLAFHNQVYRNFKSLSNRFKDRIIEIDGTLAQDEVEMEVLSHIASFV